MLHISPKLRKLVVLYIVVLLGVFLLTGCGGVSSLREKLSAPEGNKPGGPTGVSPAPEKLPPAVENGRKVLLFFSDADGNGLVAEERVIPRVEGIARATVHELIAGPAPGSPLRPTLPYGTTLKDINVRSDGTVVVDFTKELLANHSGEPPADDLTVQSIIHTLTQFPAVKQVQILVDGKYVNKLGQVSIRSALLADSGIIIPAQAVPQQ